MKKQEIFNDKYIFDDDARIDFQESQREMLDNPDYEVDIEEWADEVHSWLDDERGNLDVEVSGVIIALASIGTWRGQHNGYKIIGDNVRDILSSECDYNEWYGDGFNIRSTHSHHDGTNYVLYRVAESMEAAERIAEQVYNGGIDEAQFRKKTKSLYPYVAKQYGWKTGRFDKKKTA